MIDSGVHPGHPHIAADRLEPGAAIARDGAITVGDTIDQLGHGTAVTAAIQGQAPAAVCIPVRVFHDALRTTATALAAAIRWSIAQRVDAINLSLGTVNPAHRSLLETVAAEALSAGIALIAAGEADGVRCHPGSADGAIAVGLDRDCPRTECRMQGGVLHASGLPRSIPGIEPRRNLHGISFAVANLTGLAARELAMLDATGPERVAMLRVRLAERCYVK